MLELYPIWNRQVRSTQSYTCRRLSQADLSQAQGYERCTNRAYSGGRPVFARGTEQVGLGVRQHVIVRLLTTNLL